MRSMFMIMMQYVNSFITFIFNREINIRELRHVSQALKWALIFFFSFHLFCIKTFLMALKIGSSTIGYNSNHIIIRIGLESG